MIDPAGLKTSYEYDSYGRLTQIKDYEDKVVCAYAYNLSNMAVPTGGGIPSASITPYSIEHTFGKTVTFSTSTGNYRYNWIYKTASGTIISQNLNTTNHQFPIKFSQIGPMILVCGITDITTGERKEAMQIFNVVMPKHEINLTNISSTNPMAQPRETTAKINCLYETSINILVEMITKDTQASGYCYIGDHRIGLSPGYSQQTTVTVPAGTTEIKLILNIYSFSAAKVKLTLIDTNNSHSVVYPLIRLQQNNWR